MENFQAATWTQEEIEQMSTDFFTELGSTVSERTRKEYRMICKQVLRALRDDKPVSEKLSKAKYLQVRSVLNKLKEQRRLPDDVMVRGIPAKWTKHGSNGTSSKRKKDDAFTPATFDALLKGIDALPASKENKRQLVLASKISFGSGLRLAEVLNLQPKHVSCNEESHEIELSVEAGKGNVDRVAYLPKDMYDDMVTFQSFTMKHSYVVGVFWKLKKAGIIAGTFHALRHGAAFCWKEQGCSIVDIQHLLGHSSIDTTEKHYFPSTQGRPAALKTAGY